jgi:hypothetical protein
MENDWWLLILRTHSQCTTSTSIMKNCSMVKKILIILSEKRFYYIFIFLKVNQCKFKQKETILKLGNPLKSKSKFTKSKIGRGALPWTYLGLSDSQSNFLSVKIYSENTDGVNFVVATIIFNFFFCLFDLLWNI